MAAFPLPRLLRAFSLLLLCMAALGAHAQIDNVYVYGTVKDYNTSKRLDGITVSVYKDGALHSSVVTSANGKYEFNLDYGYEYKLLFDKPGMVGKNVVINTRQIPEEERIGGLAMNVEMTLFQDIPGIDYSLLQQPIGKSKYDPSTNMLAWDLEYTEQMRAELNRLQKEYDDRKKREASADAAFNKLMDQGSAAMAAKDYRKAVQHFTDALGLKAGDPIATARLSDAQIKLNELDQAQAQEKKYTDLIKEADGLFAKKSYAEAREKYVAATAVKEQEAYPKQKVKECDAFIADLAAQAEKDRLAKELNDKYTAAVAAGDAAFKAGRFDEARTKFTEAGELKPEEKYPPQQLAAIAAKEAELAKQQEAEEQAKALEAAYQAEITAGDDAFQRAQYEEARARYNAALAIKAKEKYPQGQLATIDKKLAELAAKAEADKQAAELEAAYQAAITAADAAFQAQRFDEARTGYQQALQIKAKEKYPTDQLAAIDKQIADLAAKAEAERLAKERDANYQAAIAAADAAFQAKDYELAKTKYNEALEVKPKEPWPTGQLAAIARALAEQAAQAEADKLAREQDAKYQALIDKGEDLFAKGAYADAKAPFQQALEVKPEEALPKERIVEIDAKLAEAARLAKEKREQEERDARYADLIASADKKFGKEAFADALNDYKDALQLKPVEPYPQERIAAINNLLDAAAQEQAELERLQREQQEKDRQYNALVEQADKDFKAASYAAATAGYTSALEVKPDEAHPADRLAEIQQLLAAQAAADSAQAAQEEAERARLAEEARRQAEADSILAAQEAAELARLEAERRRQAESEAEVQARYDDAIMMADAAFRNQAYDLAREGYQEALSAKPGEAYPQAQLQAIEQAIADRLQAEQDAIEAAEALRLAEEERLRREAAEADSLQAALDRARQEREGQQAIDDRYAQIILEADKALAGQDYPGARELFTQALDVKAEETYPQVKIAQIDKILAEQERARQERELAEQQAAEPPPAPEPIGGLDNRKELEAEEFMREAREREEAEKYGRIKRLKATVQEQHEERADAASTRQQRQGERNAAYAQDAAQLYQGSEEQRLRNAAELEAFRAALAQRGRELQQRGEEESAQALGRVRDQEAGMAQRQQDRTADHYARVQDQDAAKQDQQDRMSGHAQANRDRTESERLRVEEQLQRIAAMEQRRAALALRQQEEVERRKKAHEAREQQLRANALDRGRNEQERIGRIEPNKPRPFAAYTRNELASHYPQGVTEESYTEGNKVIIKRVVVQGNKADEYSKVIAKWGTFYFRNGQSISELIWTVNTEQ